MESSSDTLYGVQSGILLFYSILPFTLSVQTYGELILMRILLLK
jgi:hypothetical protein